MGRVFDTPIGMLCASSCRLTSPFFVRLFGSIDAKVGFVGSQRLQDIILSFEDPPCPQCRRLGSLLPPPPPPTPPLVAYRLPKATTSTRWRRLRRPLLQNNTTTIISSRTRSLADCASCRPARHPPTLLMRTSLERSSNRKPPPLSAGGPSRAGSTPSASIPVRCV